MNIFIDFILALLPLLWLILALILLKMKAPVASFITFLLSFFIAIFYFHMPAFDAVLASLEGAAMAVWPIILIILGAVFTYNLTVYSKSMNLIQKMLTSVSDDMRILVLLIGWCFGGFIEGIAGFGTAIAIPAGMLAGLGLNPVTSVLVCLIANGTPTPFGSIGIPCVTLANVIGFDQPTLAFAYSLQACLFMFVSPFLMVIVSSGSWKGLKNMFGITLVSSLSFVLPVLFVSKQIGCELAIIIASISSLIMTFIYARIKRKNHQVPHKYHIEMKRDDTVITLKNALKAWSSFILIFVFLLLTSKLFPTIHNSLNSIQTTVHFYGDYTFTWINTPGVFIFISAIIGGLIQGCRFHDFIIVFKSTFNQMSKTILTLLSVLCCAKVMGYSGMTSSIAIFFVSTLHVFYPFAAPLLGCLGTFVTGSGTSSSVLFGNVQVEAAKVIQANPYWLAASNLLGVAAGRMISPQSIAIGCAAVNIEGKDGIILSIIIKYALIFMIFMSFIVYFGQPIYNMILN